MRRLALVACVGLASALLWPVPAAQASGEHEALVAKHAAANGLPPELIRRVIKIESRGNPRVVSKGNYGLMQIRLGTAKAMGYRGSAEGLLDADTNMTYAVKYLAGAYRAAGGNQDRAVHYYQRGYYEQAKAKGFSPYQTAAHPAVAAAPSGAQPASQLVVPGTPAVVVPAPATRSARREEAKSGAPFDLLQFFADHGTSQPKPVKRKARAKPAPQAQSASVEASTPPRASVGSAVKPAVQTP